MISSCSGVRVLSVAIMPFYLFLAGLLWAPSWFGASQWRSWSFWPDSCFCCSCTGGQVVHRNVGLWQVRRCSLRKQATQTGWWRERNQPVQQWHTIKAGLRSWSGLEWRSLIWRIVARALRLRAWPGPILNPHSPSHGDVTELTEMSTMAPSPFRTPGFPGISRLTVVYQPSTGFFTWVWSTGETLSSVFTGNWLSRQTQTDAKRSPWPVGWVAAKTWTQNQLWDASESLENTSRWASCRAPLMCWGLRTTSWEAAAAGSTFPYTGITPRNRSVPLQQDRCSPQDGILRMWLHQCPSFTRGACPMLPGWLNFCWV